MNDSRIAIVTSANSGVGLQTTIGPAKAGLEVMMACRSLGKANAARAEVSRAAPAARLEVM